MLNDNCLKKLRNKHKICRKRSCSFIRLDDKVAGMGMQMDSKVQRDKAEAETKLNSKNSKSNCVYCNKSVRIWITKWWLPGLADEYLSVGNIYVSNNFVSALVSLTLSQQPHLKVVESTPHISLAKKSGDWKDLEKWIKQCLDCLVWIGLSRETVIFLHLCILPAFLTVL